MTWPAAGHHSVLGFDSHRSVRVSGIVHEVVWDNPHALIRLHLDAESGRGERWTIESESPAVLTRLGWTRTSVKAGDRIHSVGAPAKNGTRLMRCQYVEPASAARLPCFPSGAL